MPEGSTQPPPGPEDQIKQEVSTGRVMEWLGGLFGAEWENTAGGGGTGGTFMFASIADLDSVIAQWETELDAISKDGERIRRAAGFIQPPAQDGMSEGLAKATRDSLLALLKHNEAMRDYARDYVRRLRDSRQSMVNNDQSGQARMNNLNRG